MGDIQERCAQIERIENEMGSLTTRKVDVLTEEIKEYEMRQRAKGAAQHKADKQKEKFQINRLAREMDNIREGLLIVANAMETMSGNMSESHAQAERRKSDQVNLQV